MNTTELMVYFAIALFSLGVGYSVGLSARQPGNASYDAKVRKEFVKRLENKYGYVIVQGKTKAILQNDIYDCIDEYE